MTTQELNKRGQYMKDKVLLAYLSAILNALIIGFSFLFTKTAILQSSPLDTLAFRFTAAFLGLSILMLLRVVKLNIKLKSLIKLLPLTLFYPTFFFSFQAYGLKFSTSAEGGILFATIPILTVILASIFLKETTTLIQKAAIGLSVFGVIFIFVMKGSTINISNVSGISLLILSCLTLSGYTVLARTLTKVFKPMEMTYFMLGVGFIFFNTINVISHIYSKTLDSIFVPLKNVDFIIAILFLGILASFVTSLLSNFILTTISASQMSVFSNLSTVVSIIAGAVILNEEIHYYHIIGSVLIIVGVICTNYFKKEVLPASSTTNAISK